MNHDDHAFIITTELPDGMDEKTFKRLCIKCGLDCDEILEAPGTYEIGTDHAWSFYTLGREVGSYLSINKK